MFVFFCLISFIFISSFVLIQKTVSRYSKDIQLIPQKIQETVCLYLKPATIAKVIIDTAIRNSTNQKMKNLDVNDKLDEFFHKVSKRIPYDNTKKSILISENFFKQNTTVKRSFNDHNKNELVF